MARRFQQDENDGETKVDMSPLIDCVFILLIFFIVTTTFVDEKGKQMPTPDSAAAAEPTDEESTVVMLEITERGEVLHEGQAVGVGSVQTLIQNSPKGRRSPVVIQAVGDARVGLLMRVKEEAERSGAETISVTHRHGGS
ncbi:MAG: biopolymer transporter ExbD [Phycisphaeraceae bacterium]|nr:biopolymer transporter ExbD [Phycisphaeraceae bacterium]